MACATSWKCLDAQTARPATSIWRRQKKTGLARRSTSAAFAVATAQGEGCTNPSADNYDADALADDGSCTFGNGLCTGLSYDLVAGDPLGTGASTYRIYANFTSPDVEVTAIYGTDSEPWTLVGNAPFYQDAFRF